MEQRGQGAKRGKIELWEGARVLEVKGRAGGDQQNVAGSPTDSQVLEGPQRWALSGPDTPRNRLREGPGQGQGHPRG